MDLREQWIDAGMLAVWRCRGCEALQDDSASRRCWQCGEGNWEEIHVVPLDHLRGAVEALEQARHLLAEHERQTGPLPARVEAALDALTDIGGQ